MQAIWHFLKSIEQNLERWLLLVFYTILVSTMAVEVLRREAFEYSSVWGEEIVRFSFIYLSWIAAAAAVKERAHIRIDVIFHSFSTRGKAVLYLLGEIAMLIAALYAIYWSWETVHLSFKFGSETDGLRLPRYWFLFAVPFGFGLMLLRLSQSMIRDVRAIVSGEAPFEGNKLFD